MKIKAENFQSWESLSFEVEGLTAIIGPSDAGKTAVFRALLGIVRNELSAAQVRTGEDELKVILEHEGTTVEATRGVKSSSKYVINGSPFKKLNRAVPGEITDLKMNPIKIGDVVLDPIFADQHEGKFLLQGMGSTALNAVLGAFSATEKLEMGKREANAVILAKNSEARILAKEVQESEARKLQLQELQDKLTPIAARVAANNLENERLQEIARHLTGALIHKRSREHLQYFSSRISPVDTSPVVQLSSARVLSQGLVGSTRKYRRIRAILDRLDVVEAPYWVDQLAAPRALAQVGNSRRRLLAAQKVETGICGIESLVQEVRSKASTLQYVWRAGKAKELGAVREQFLKDRMAVLELEMEQAKEEEKDVREKMQSRKLVECPKCHHQFEADKHKCEE